MLHTFAFPFSEDAVEIVDHNCRTFLVSPKKTAQKNSLRFRVIGLLMKDAQNRALFGLDEKGFLTLPVSSHLTAGFAEECFAEGLLQRFLGIPHTTKARFLYSQSLSSPLCLFSLYGFSLKDKSLLQKKREDSNFLLLERHSFNALLALEPKKPTLLKLLVEEKIIERFYASSVDKDETVAFSLEHGPGCAP